MMNDKTEINVMIVEADKVPYMARIPNTVEDYEEIIGGELEKIAIEENKVALLFDKNAYNNGREPNRTIFDTSGEPIDIICGNFIIAGLDEGKVNSLSLEDALKYYDYFYNPNFFGLNEDREVTYYEYHQEFENERRMHLESEMGMLWEEEREML